ncbi:MAG: hypothetical protein QOK37_2784 [Thermoanaerobaculia bacterium]|nr:hypothetical protein [Thermoanaerobaculia bacterium]
MSVRRAILGLSLAAIVAMCIEPGLLRMPFIDREPQAMAFARSADRWPQYPRFLEGIRAHTQAGDTIAIVVPALEWERGYSYAYYRASYFLTGREVLPYLDPQNARLPENLHTARYVAAFGVSLRAPADVIWQGDGGALLRLRR